jgi:hypothetical protein
MRRSKHVFLMCPPEYFNVAYIINPWMHGNLRKIDNAVAKQQWRALYDTLTDHATVRLVLPQPGSPDMVFTANAGLVRGKRFIVSRFRYPERQYEEPYFADWFMDRGYDVSLMPRDVPFEGAGDALFDRGQGRALDGPRPSLDFAGARGARQAHRHGGRDVAPGRPALLSSRHLLLSPGGRVSRCITHRPSTTPRARRSRSTSRLPSASRSARRTRSRSPATR